MKGCRAGETRWGEEAVEFLEANVEMEIHGILEGEGIHRFRDGKVGSWSAVRPEGAFQRREPTPSGREAATSRLRVREGRREKVDERQGIPYVQCGKSSSGGPSGGRQGTREARKSCQ